MKAFALLILGLYISTVEAQFNSSELDVAQFDEYQNASYLDLFPLHIGNCWQYKITVDSGFNEEDTIYYANKSVLKDTMMPNGKLYKEIYDERNFVSNDSLYFLRIDSTTGCIYNFSEYFNEEYLIDSLAMMTGDMMLTGYGSSLECLAVDSVVLFGVTRLEKYFFVHILPRKLEYKYAEGIGEFYRYNYDEFIVGVEITSEITYAKINGIEYGQLVFIDNDIKKDYYNFILNQNYPNPFNPSTTLSFVIGHQSFVALKVYDILGNEVATLINEEKPAGEYEVEFNAINLPSGIYFYNLKAGEFNQTRKMILLK